MFFIYVLELFNLFELNVQALPGITGGSRNLGPFFEVSTILTIAFWQS